MGNVKEQKLIDIISSPTFKKFKDKIREKGTVGGCNRCGYLLPKDDPKILDKNTPQEIKETIFEKRDNKKVARKTEFILNEAKVLEEQKKAAGKSVKPAAEADAEKPKKDE